MLGADGEMGRESETTCLSKMPAFRWEAEAQSSLFCRSSCGGFRLSVQGLGPLRVPPVLWVTAGPR